MQERSKGSSNGVTVVQLWYPEPVSGKIADLSRQGIASAWGDAQGANKGDPFGSDGGGQHRKISSTHLKPETHTRHSCAQTHERS